MSDAETGDEGFYFEVPVWTIIEASQGRREPFVLAHQTYGPTVLIFTDEDAARTVVERAAPPGHEPYILDTWPIVRLFVETLERQRQVQYVGIDLLPNLTGRFVRTGNFLAAIDRAAGRPGPVRRGPNPPPVGQGRRTRRPA